MKRVETTPIENSRDDPNTRWTLVARSSEELVDLINGDWVDTEKHWLRVVEDYKTFSTIVKSSPSHYPVT